MTNTENIRRWIEQSDIDYITYFIKAWIPFNAWYNSDYPELHTDRGKINKIKNDSNSFRNKINTLMEGSGQESEEFKSFLSSLHQELLNTEIKGRGNIRIWFDDILKETNQKNKISENYNRVHYFLEVKSNESIKINLNKISDNSSIFSYSHSEYKLDDLEANSNYLNLSQTRREQIRHYFNQLNPKITKPVIQRDLNNSECFYKCDTHHFVRDRNNSNCYSISLCKALIELLYQLRNVLFHGELVPNEDSQKVYKNAYFCLKYLLVSLR